MKHVLALLALVPFSALAVACSSSGSKTAATTVDAGAEDQGDPGDTQPMADSTAVGDVQNAGIDTTSSLEDAMSAAEAADTAAGTHDKVHAIMQSFSTSLGVECDYCHSAKLDDKGNPVTKNGKAQLDYSADTPKKRVASHMWNDWVSQMTVKDSDTPLYCDSCHQGAATFLDRDDDDKLKSWMKQNFAAKLVTTSGDDVKCTTCHGKPFDDQFLSGWEGGDQ